MKGINKKTSPYFDVWLNTSRFQNAARLVMLFNHKSMYLVWNTNISALKLMLFSSTDPIRSTGDRFVLCSFIFRYQYFARLISLYRAKKLYRKLVKKRSDQNQNQNQVQCLSSSTIITNRITINDFSQHFQLKDSVPNFRTANWIWMWKKNGKINTIGQFNGLRCVFSICSTFANGTHTDIQLAIWNRNGVNIYETIDEWKIARR